MTGKPDEDKDDTGELNDDQLANTNRQPAKEQGSTEASALDQEAERLQSALNTHLAKSDMTTRLGTDELAQLPEASRLAFGAQPEQVKWYRKLPISMGTAELPKDVPRWRVEIEGLAPAVEAIGLDIIGDAVIGRGRVGTQPADLDLDQFGALEQGVSRRHALLRPTANHLYIIDLGSTNGTLHNGLPLGPGIARSLKNNDTITLGRLSFTVKLIDGPSMRRPLHLDESEEEGERTRPLTTETGGAAQPYTAETKSNQPRITPQMIEQRRRELNEQEKKD